MNQTIQELYNRKSVRVFEDKEIGQEELQFILEASKQAPTAGNMMMYSIIHVTDQKKKEILAEKCDHQPFIATAKLVLVYCADFQKYDDLFRAHVEGEVKKPKEAELFLGIQDAVIAAQNAVVAAESLGIGSCYIGDILENKEDIQTLLELPTYTLPICMLVFGYPTTQQKERIKPTRFKTEYVVFKNSYKRLNQEELDDMIYANIKHIPEMTTKKYITNLYNRKFRCEFMDEMARSVKAWLESWK